MLLIGSGKMKIQARLRLKASSQQVEDLIESVKGWEADMFSNPRVTTAVLSNPKLKAEVRIQLPATKAISEINAMDVDGRYVTLARAERQSGSENNIIKLLESVGKDFLPSRTVKDLVNKGWEEI